MFRDVLDIVVEEVKVEVDGRGSDVIGVVGTHSKNLHDLRTGDP